MDLLVPSDFVPAERNLILSRDHKDFPALETGEPEPFVFDPRLLGSGGIKRV